MEPILIMVLISVVNILLVLYISRNRISNKAYENLKIKYEDYITHLNQSIDEQSKEMIKQEKALTKYKAKVYDLSRYPKIIDVEDFITYYLFVIFKFATFFCGFKTYSLRFLVRLSAFVRIANVYGSVLA